ncbi:hypothetical protein DFH11DRAFT_315582 [Phellopilus nigrolimitatus]|nr:hypothetical protein DFH11DRAFT_315582 [Phellopilus nigrolimitatus]
MDEYEAGTFGANESCESRKSRRSGAHAPPLFPISLCSIGPCSTERFQTGDNLYVDRMSITISSHPHARDLRRITTEASCLPNSRRRSSRSKNRVQPESVQHFSGSPPRALASRVNRRLTIRYFLTFLLLHVFFAITLIISDCVPDFSRWLICGLESWRNMCLESRHAGTCPIGTGTDRQYS